MLWSFRFLTGNKIWSFLPNVDFLLESVIQFAFSSVFFVFLRPEIKYHLLRFSDHWPNHTFFYMFEIERQLEKVTLLLSSSVIKELVHLVNICLLPVMQPLASKASLQNKLLKLRVWIDMVNVG